jgi:phosphoribosylamine--glycine ligase
VKVLIVGKGGREHALAWKAAQSARVERVFVAPGNAGTSRERNVENVAIDPLDFDTLVAFALRTRVDLTVVGPEVPLVAGIRDRFDAEGLACFGPTRAAAQLEGSKAFTKAFMARHGIPTARYETFGDADAARRYIERVGAPIVVKADGLAAGKGVTVARTVAEAVDAAQAMLSGAAFGAAGRQVVIEEFMEGEEASFICVADGKTALPFASSQDHKARDDGDRGPNTGGLGAYSPAPVVTPAVHARVMREIIEPTLAGMAKDGHPFSGFLYAGLMIRDGAPRVVEFNCRFGDPEAQPMMMRLRSDIVEVWQAVLEQRVDRLVLEWDPRAALGVVMAAGGYPLDYRKGDPIDGIERAQSDDVKVFFADTKDTDGTLVTDGGRVLCVVGLGERVSDAQRTAYEAVKKIRFRDAYYRRDIGYRAIARESRFGNRSHK